MFDESAAAVVKELPRFEPHVPSSIQILNHPYVSSLPLHTDQPFVKVNPYLFILILLSYLKTAQLRQLKVGCLLLSQIFLNYLATRSVIIP